MTTNEHLAVERVVTSLAEYGLRKVDSKLKAGDLFSFDAVLVGEDPQPIFVVEYKTAANPKAIRDYVRKLESLAWALYSEGKHHTITAILIVEKGFPGQTLESLSKKLIGTCRIFILPDDFSAKQLNTALLPLSRPAVVRRDVRTQEAGDVADALAQLKLEVEGTRAAGLVSLSRNCGSAEEMSVRLDDEFQKRVKELEDALTEAEA